ncbi:MAG TPA: tetratricopeptide repeat protein [Chitinophagales bacterium]|nr:tetratricopeptide repeat protein [Chitinophagales bacterium]
MRNLIFGFVIVSIVSCSFHEKRKNDAMKALKKADTSITSNHPDTLAIEQARKAVQSFIQRFPDDTLSPAYLFELALLYEKQRQYDSTIKTLDRIYSFYPHSKQASKAVFLEGFLYANVLNQLDKAKETYQFYLDHYANLDSKMTNDVKMELQNLGKSPEEILKEIQEKAAKDSTEVPL